MDSRGKLEQIFLEAINTKGFVVLSNNEEIAIYFEKDQENKAFSTLQSLLPSYVKDNVQSLSDVLWYDPTKKYHKIEYDPDMVIEHVCANSSDSVISPSFWTWAEDYDYLIDTGILTEDDVKLSNPFD